MSNESTSYIVCVPFGGMIQSAMTNRQCIRALASWLSIGAGFYVYETAGLISASIPFFFAALLRGDRDKQFAQERILAYQRIYTAIKTFAVSFEIEHTPIS